MVERDWDRDFDLAAWRALSTAQRIAWIEQAWRREDEREEQGGAPPELPITRRQRYERGQTAWDIGLDPQPFDIALAQAVGEVKPELAHGVVAASVPGGRRGGGLGDRWPRVARLSPDARPATEYGPRSAR